MNTAIKKIIGLVVCLFALSHTTSCQEKQSQMEWKYIDFNKIPGETLWKDYANAITKYEFKQVLNYNKDIFFLLGDDSQNDALAEPNSIVFSTTDFGDTWHKTSFGKGSVEYGMFVGQKLLVLVQNNDFPSSQLRKSTVYLSEDWGKTWKEIMVTSEGENIYEMCFYSEKIGIASFEINIVDKDDKIYEFRYTEDGGKTWKKANIDVDSYQFRPMYNCVFTSDSTLIYIENNTQLIEFDLKTNQKRLVKKLSVPQDMKLSDINIDQKTKQAVAFYLGKEQGSGISGLYYINEDEYIPLPNRYYVSTYGDYYYALVFEKPFSTYVWSTDRGKTWTTEKLDYIMLFTSRPKSYYGEGYIYIEASLFRSKDSHLGKGARFGIGRPIIKE